MIGIIDYDAGNIRSVEKALSYLGEKTVVSRDPDILKSVDKVILPGVGSFGQAMENLHRYELVPVIRDMIEDGKPFLGICLGLQLLFESSEESPGAEGLGILKGKILKIPVVSGLEDPSYGMEFPAASEQWKTVSGIFRKIRMYILYIPIIFRQRSRKL